MRVRTAARKSALNTIVANLMEAKPDPGSAAVKKAPNKAIKAKIRIQPNIYLVSPGAVYKLPLVFRESTAATNELKITFCSGTVYLPMQKVEKIRFRISSAVVAPVIASRG
jgi:hypothetical protein